MCRRFIPIDCDEVARIAAEIERDLAAHADELASLDPIEAYEDFLFFPESAQPDRAEQRAKREEAPVQLSLFDGAEDMQRRERQQKLDKTVDALRERFGKRSVVFAHLMKKEDQKDDDTPF